MLINIHFKPLFVSLLFCFSVSAVALPDKPNIIFILTDDMGYGDLSSYGSTTIATPHIDQLAKKGLKFTDFYAASSVCSPSRAALLTGRYPARLGIQHVFRNDSVDGLQLAEITIAEQLKSAGYATGMIGKWHLGHLDRYMPWNQGFDEFYGVPFSNDMGNFFFYENQNIIYQPIDQRFLTERYTLKALDFIEQHQSQPFFLYLAHSMPHTPLYASPEFEGKSKGGLYGDVVEELDASTGRIMAQLTKLDLLENTLVVFTSDNGPWLMMQDHAGSAGNLRDGKTVTFEGGQRVPAIVQWPAVIKPNSEYTGIATMMDWFVTFSALAGVPLPDDRIIDGKNISSILQSGKAHEEQDFYYLSAMKTKPVAYRQGDWKFKLARKGYPRFLDRILKINLYSHPELLFNLADDPEEKHNLAKQHPERVASMRQKIAHFESSLAKQPVRALNMKGTKADRKGFGKPLKAILIVAVPTLILIGIIIYGAYRVIKVLFCRLSRK